ncbi:hypothetical protein ACN38_g12295 [Penicillium nordicum]|uniref:Uncharacterized protein n=1 Tax=Penicillium nordicum TaxID=229535 RepID=A0A0M8NTG0_9EURO|nr:hypothetical protein ACN38_g12295 [Penicillium nordicum]
MNDSSSAFPPTIVLSTTTVFICKNTFRLSCCSGKESRKRGGEKTPFVWSSPQNAQVYLSPHGLNVYMDCPEKKNRIKRRVAHTRSAGAR